MKQYFSQNKLDLTLYSSLALAFACFGDAFLYPALPVNIEEFGISVGWIGFILSVNRLIRIAGNHYFVGLFNQYGFRRLTIMASVISVITTACYGLNIGIGPLVMVRIVWGLSFAILRISAIHYSMQSPKQGIALGVGKAIQESGPLLALAIGPLLITYFQVRNAFLMLAIISLAAVLFARKLPEINAQEKSDKYKLSWKVSPFNLIVFFISLIADGALVVVISKLFSSFSMSVIELTTICSFLLAYRRFSSLLFAPIAGWLADKWGVHKMFISSIFIFSIGVFLIILGYTYPGLIIAFTMNSINSALTPGTVVKEGHKNQLALVASAATARDMGAALGTFFGGGLIIYPLLYSQLSLALLIVLLLSAVAHYSRNSKFKFTRLFYYGNRGSI